MLKFLKKLFGFADVNHDGKVDAADAAVVTAKVSAVVEEAQVRVADVVEESKVVAADVVKVVEAAKGKGKRGRKAKAK